MSEELKKEPAEKDKKATKPVDATSSSRQNKDEASSEKRGEGAASTKGSAKPAEPPKPSEPSKPVSEEPKEPDWKTLYALTLADFDNYKKRAARDREDVYRYAESDILKDVLPAIDNLQLALASAKTVDAAPSPRQNEGDSAFAAFVKGVQLVYDTLLKSLKDHGAEPFDSVGKELDTEKMEAIATLPSAEVEAGKVSIESKKGWMLKDKVLRAAQVVVSSGKHEEKA